MNLRKLYLLFFLLSFSQSVIAQVKIINLSLLKPDSNILYVGIENKLKIQGLENFNNIRLFHDGLRANSSKDGIFYLHVPSRGISKIKIYYLKKRIISREFYKNVIPSPIAGLGIFSDTTISILDIINEQELKVFLPNCILNMKFGIRNFNTKIVSKKGVQDFGLTYGNKLPSNLITIISKLESGDKIIFDEIRTSGPDHAPILDFYINVK